MRLGRQTGRSSEGGGAQAGQGAWIEQCAICGAIVTDPTAWVAFSWGTPKVWFCETHMRAALECGVAWVGGSPVIRPKLLGDTPEMVAVPPGKWTIAFAGQPERDSLDRQVEAAHAAAALVEGAVKAARLGRHILSLELERHALGLLEEGVVVSAGG